ncbi:MAG: phosphoribosyl-AMP cyclohydrolase [SAR324 cluster bacterium]|nr:phosphoribosyl-AMP cyclohydrolase [SAR324 cluster bacterium]MBL7034291.1 phosphoribosyl-AMP cyclohydrolase [SAR324 cluster bacterium]
MTKSENTETANNNPGIADLAFEKQDGLLPVIAQDADSGAVLMLAYANPEAVQKTLESGYAHYWSRSREALWKKGESSGHLQKIVEVLVDCDQDTLLYKVQQSGPACHTGAPTCFFQKLETNNTENLI